VDRQHEDRTEDGHDEPDGIAVPVPASDDPRTPRRRRPRCRAGPSRWSHPGRRLLDLSPMETRSLAGAAWRSR